MKVVKAKEMARIEGLAYRQGASEEGFMNEAGRGIANRVLEMLSAKGLAGKGRVTLLCGPGNNGGDAYVAGRLLKKAKVEVHALAIKPLKECSPLCKLQGKRFRRSGGKIHYIKDGEPVPFFNADFLLDGILGTGFHGHTEGPFSALIDVANNSGIPIISIDIPSGINGNTGEVGGTAIRATETIFLGLPKTGCFIGDAWNYTGKCYLFNFGLKEQFIDQAQEDFIFLTDNMIESMFPKLRRNRHKYEAGYVVGLGGSPGMPGAPTMASFASLKCGAGIVRLLHPKGMELEFAGAPEEIVRVPYTPQDKETMLHKLNASGGCFIGPGFGTSKEAKKLLEEILPDVRVPCVIDAEALTLLAELDIPFPENTILTPHHGEMKRLLHIKEKEFPILDLFELCNQYVEAKRVTLVLKGSPTFIFSPYATRFISTRGDPGMASAGSGDVLTGMIAAFLAQGKGSVDAACLGVYLHGIAGEYAAERLTPYCMTATDITSSLPYAFFYFKHAWY